MLIINRTTEAIFDLENLERVKANKWSTRTYKSGNIEVRETKDNKTMGRYLFEPRGCCTILRKDNTKLDYRASNIYMGNIYVDKGNYYEVECFDGRKFLISKEDYDTVKDNVWHIDKNNYAITKLKGGRVIKQHRLLMGIVDDHTKEVDHINHDTCDNRRENLRFSDRSLNCLNRRKGRGNKSGVVGVYLHNSGYGWAATLKSKDNPKGYLGIYKTKEEAIAVRKTAEEQYNISTEW